MTAQHRIEPHPKKYVSVNGKRMAYVELGAGESVFLFIHGNPTSSYLWRNVMPEVAGLGRCIAPDLIGMGDSAKLDPAGPDSYNFTTHQNFLTEFIDTVLGPDCPVTLVLHDWGSALGFDWANHHRGRVTAIAYMEAIVRPLTWKEWPKESQRMFEGLRAATGEQMILEKNLFIERILPASILRALEPAEMNEYRRPFAGPAQDRWPMLAWPRALPLDGVPAEVVDAAQAYADWMAQNSVPKLFINAEPGSILVGPQREFCRQWQNQKEVTVRGSHFIQEDSGPEIGHAIAEWSMALTAAT